MIIVVDQHRLDFRVTSYFQNLSSFNAKHVHVIVSVIIIQENRVNLAVALSGHNAFCRSTAKCNFQENL